MATAVTLSAMAGGATGAATDGDAPPTAPPSVRRGLPVVNGWSAGGVRLFAALLVLLQLIQGVSAASGLASTPFTQSYYLITYRQGFVRRGLFGEGLHLLFGVPTRSEVNLVADLESLVTLVAVLVVIDLLVRRGTGASYAMALVVAASPFTVDYLVADHRPDILALAVLVVLGVVLLRAGPWLWPGLFGVGLAFGALVLVHEDVVLVQVPWAVALVCVATLGSRGRLVGAGATEVGGTLLRRVAAVLGPPALAMVAVVTYGLPSAQKVRSLQRDVATFHLGPGTMFDYLPDTVSQSIRRVWSISTSSMAHTLVLGGVILVLQVAWVVRWTHPNACSPFLRTGNRGLGLVVTTVIGVATLALFATGVDWLRWFANCGAAWLVVQAFSILLLEPAPDRREPAGRVQLSPWLPALAVYLAAIPPLDLLATSGLIKHYLFFT